MYHAAGIRQVGRLTWKLLDEIFKVFDISVVTPWANGSWLQLSDIIGCLSQFSSKLLPAFISVGPA